MFKIVKLQTLKERCWVSVDKWFPIRHAHLPECSGDRNLPKGSRGCVCVKALKAREVVKIAESREKRSVRNRNGPQYGN